MCMAITLTPSCLYSEDPVCTGGPNSQISVSHSPLKSHSGIRQWWRHPSPRHDLLLSCLLPRASVFLLMVTCQHKWIHLSQSAGFSLAQMLGGEKWRDVESQGSSGCLAWSKLLCPNGAHFPPELKKGVWNVLCWSLLALIIMTIVCIPTSHTHSSLRVWPWIIHPLTGQSSDRW